MPREQRHDFLIYILTLLIYYPIYLFTLLLPYEHSDNTGTLMQVTDIESEK